MGTHDLLRALRRRRGVIALCLVLVGGSALCFSLLQTKEYSASASLLFRDPALDQSLLGYPVLPPSSDAEREGTTNLKLVSLPVVGERTARSLGRPGLPVLGKIAVSQEGESNVISVTATDESPQFASQLANAFAREYIAFRRGADRAKIVGAQALVQKQYRALTRRQRGGARGRILRDRIEQLGLLATLQTGNAELVQPAGVPGSPSSPKPARNLVLGSLLGLILGIGLALLLGRLDRRIRDPEEVEEIFGRPILAAIPLSKAFGPESTPEQGLPPVEAEAFRMLRASRRYLEIDREMRSVLITSAAPGDGKSTTAWNLAAAEAAAGKRVLLIEADLRHPVLASRYGITGKGLSDVLVGEDPRDCVTSGVVIEPDERGGAATIDVMPAGTLPPNPSDLMETERMRSVVERAVEIYDLVLLDTPPTPIVSDAIPLLKAVEGVVVVTRIGKTSREACAHLRNQLDHVSAPLLGVVVNGIDTHERGYYGSMYAYDYGTPSPPSRSRVAGGATRGHGLGDPAQNGPAPNGGAPEVAAHVKRAVD